MKRSCPSWWSWWFSDLAWSPVHLEIFSFVTFFSFSSLAFTLCGHTQMLFFPSWLFLGYLRRVFLLFWSVRYNSSLQHPLSKQNSPVGSQGLKILLPHCSGIKSAVILKFQFSRLFFRMPIFHDSNYNSLTSSKNFYFPDHLPWRIAMTMQRILMNLISREKGC